MPTTQHPAFSDLRQAILFGLRVVGLACCVLFALLWIERILPPHVFATIPGAPGVGTSIKTQLFDKEKSLKDTVLLTGDSVITATAGSDSNRRTLFSMLQQRLAIPVKDISNSAYDQRVFHSQLVALEDSTHNPRVLLVGINLRSFSPNWEDNPYVQRKDLIDYNNFPYGAALYRAWRIIKPDNTAANAREEWDRRASQRPEPENSIRQGFQDAYCYDLQDSEGLKHLNKSLKLREKLPFKVVFYLTPINFGKAHEHLSPKDLEILEGNLEKLRAILVKSGAVWEDYSKSLAPEDFYHSPSIPDEHLNETGRIWLAEKLKKLAVRNSLEHTQNP